VKLAKILDKHVANLWSSIISQEFVGSLKVRPFVTGGLLKRVANFRGVTPCGTESLPVVCMGVKLGFLYERENISREC